MIALNANWEAQNATRGICRADRPALAYGHLNNLSGQAILLPVRATPGRAAHTSARRPGFYSIANQLARQSAEFAFHPHQSVLSQFRLPRCCEANRSELTDAKIIFAEATKARTHD